MPTAQANTIRLCYEIHGAGQPLVFIHGLGSSTRDWQAQVPAFATSYQVFTFDLRGQKEALLHCPCGWELAWEDYFATSSANN